MAKAVVTVTGSESTRLDGRKMGMVLAKPGLGPDSALACTAYQQPISPVYYKHERERSVGMLVLGPPYHLPAQILRNAVLDHHVIQAIMGKPLSKSLPTWNKICCWPCRNEDGLVVQ